MVYNCGGESLTRRRPLCVIFSHMNSENGFSFLGYGAGKK